MATSESDAVKRAPEKRRLTRLFGPTDDEATVEQLGRDREDSVRDEDAELESDDSEDAISSGEDVVETTTTAVAADEALEAVAASSAPVTNAAVVMRGRSNRNVTSSPRKTISAFEVMRKGRRPAQRMSSKGKVVGSGFQRVRQRHELTAEPGSEIFCIYLRHRDFILRHPTRFSSLERIHTIRSKRWYKC